MTERNDGTTERSPLGTVKWVCFDMGILDMEGMGILDMEGMGILDMEGMGILDMEGMEI